MLSQFAHKIRLNKDNYAVINSLLFEPILMNKIEVDNLWKGEFSYFSKEDIKILNKKGIIVNDKNVDKEVKENIKKTINNILKKGVDLIYIIPIDACNLACKYCFIGNIKNKKDQIISKETIENTIKKFLDHLRKNNNKNGQVIFYGGEPTLNIEAIRYSVEIIKKYSEQNIKICIVTNTTLFDNDMLNFLKDSNIFVGISIDGPKELNDKYRIFKNSNRSEYDLVIENIDKIKEKNIDFGLSVTLSNESLDNKNFLKWLKDLNIKNINFNLMHYSENNNEWREYYKKVSKFLFKSHDFLSPFDIIDSRLLRKIKGFDDKNFMYSDCAASGAQQLTIKPNGDITVCHGYWNSNVEKCGNINKNSFEDVFETDIYRKWKNNLTINKKQCLKCPAISICGGGCPKQSEVLFGDQYKIDKPFCIHTKYSLKELLKRSFDIK